ncbi:hypothetical protein KGM_203002 [Danaus plexippus plexippus]|uniref:Uncharacterized protein n=1 Tax=Danaus plexippus plexippus TaxID=278856 RepID=A0A212EKH0_DANPL|nr:hypothetical protein KGM_203002 [Danaus plexippus plexippus]
MRVIKINRAASRFQVRHLISSCIVWKLKMSRLGSFVYIAVALAAVSLATSKISGLAERSDRRCLQFEIPGKSDHAFPMNKNIDPNKLQTSVRVVHTRSPSKTTSDDMFLQCIKHIYHTTVASRRKRELIQKM